MESIGDSRESQVGATGWRFSSTPAPNRPPVGRDEGEYFKFAFCWQKKEKRERDEYLEDNEEEQDGEWIQHNVLRLEYFHQGQEVPTSHNGICGIALDSLFFC